MIEYDNNEVENTESKLPVHIPQRKRLSRSKSDRILLGLCGGVAEYFNLEPTVVRILFVLSILVGGWGLILYLLAALFIPASVSIDYLDPELKLKTDRINNKILLGGSLMLIGFFFTFNIYGLIQYFTFIGVPPKIFWAFFLFGAGFLIFTRTSSAINIIDQENLIRSKDNRRIAGICGGFSRYLNVDSNMIRMLWLIFSFVTLGIGFIVYVLLWLTVPVEEDENE